MASEVLPLLAAQAILADVFSYLVIFFDKPFKAGDFIVVGDKSGIVEYTGIKTTRLRTLDGEQLIISNTDLTNSRVQNFKRMENRRVLLNLKLTYDTAPEKLRDLPARLKDHIESLECTRFDRAHFARFGDFSLDFEVVYYVMTADYNQYMDLQQKVGFLILDWFAREGINFAYPTQKIMVASPLHEKIHNGNMAAQQ